MKILKCWFVRSTLSVSFGSALKHPYYMAGAAKEKSKAILSFDWLSWRLRWAQSDAVENSRLVRSQKKRLCLGHTINLSLPWILIIFLVINKCSKGPDQRNIRRPSPQEYVGSLYFSGKLPTYPSPTELTLTLSFHLRQNIDLGEGKVGSFPETYNHVSQSYGGVRLVAY